MGFWDGWDGKESPCNAGDLGSIPGSGRSPGEKNGYLLQYFSLENSMDTGPWQTMVHGHKESDMIEWLTLFHLIMLSRSVIFFQYVLSSYYVLTDKPKLNLTSIFLIIAASILNNVLSSLWTELFSIIKCPFCMFITLQSEFYLIW